MNLCLQTIGSSICGCAAHPGILTEKLHHWCRKPPPFQGFSSGSFLSIQASDGFLSSMVHPHGFLSLFFLFGPLGSFRHTSNTFAALRTPSGSKWAHGPHVDGWLHLFQGSTGEYNHHLWIFIWIFMNITTIYGFLWIFIWIIWIS